MEGELQAGYRGGQQWTYETTVPTRQMKETYADGINGMILDRQR